MTLALVVHFVLIIHARAQDKGGEKKFDFKGGFGSRFKLNEDRLKKLVADTIEVRPGVWDACVYGACSGMCNSNASCSSPPSSLSA